MTEALRPGARPGPVKRDTPRYPVHIQVMVTRKTAGKLLAAADHREISVSELIRELIEEHLR